MTTDGPWGLLIPMPTFTFVPQFGDEPPDPRAEFTRDLTDVDAAHGHALSWFHSVPPNFAMASLAVGCGQGADVDWLGVYDWERSGGSPTWSPDD